MAEVSSLLVIIASSLADRMSKLLFNTGLQKYEKKTNDG